MYKVLILFIVFATIIGNIHLTNAQEFQFSTFQETAQLLIDPINSESITASITLQSTDNQEIRIPSQVNEKILDSKNILAVVITNEEQCVLGVVNDSCIMINISREGIEGGIIATQDTAREIGDSLIENLNEVFDTDATFHSAFIHTQDKINTSLETSGVISGKGTVSAVYTMTTEDTFSMYEKLSTMLISSNIREDGGFYDAAKQLSQNQESTITFSIIPIENKLLYQLKVSLEDKKISSSLSNINTLEYFQTSELKRSNYFSDGLYPLNSLVHVVVFSLNPMKEIIINTNQIPYSVLDGEKIPNDLTTNGWLFDGNDQKLDAKYLFGDKVLATSNDLQLEMVYEQKITEPNDIQPNSFELDESLMFIIIIVIVAVAASVFYLKGYKK